MGYRGQAISALALFVLLAGCSQQGQPPDPGQGASQAQAQGQQTAAGFPQAGMTQGQQPMQQAGMPPQLDTSTMQSVQIIDSNGFAQPMVAANLQIPAGWQPVGGITWNDATTCIGNQLQVSWSAIAPDSLTAVEILPGFNWQVAGTEMQMNPCPAAPYRSTREFLEATVQRTRPGARVLDYQEQPEVAEKVAQLARAAQANGQPAMQGQARTDAGRLLIAYTKDGVEMREVLSAVVSFTELQGNVVGGTATISSIRAPNNRLDMELGKRIGDSMRSNPQWIEAMKQRSMASLQRSSSAQSNSINDWHNRQMSIINARGAADRAAIRMRTNKEVSGIYSAIAAGNSASSDVIQRQTVDGINERNSYAGTDGSVVQSSIHGGDRVFQDNANPANTYSANDPYHDPANATELEQLP